MTTTTTETKTDHNIIQQDQDTTTKILEETSASSPAFENEITATITDTNMTVTTADTTTTKTTTDNNDVFPPSTSTTRSTSESPPPPATPPATTPPAGTATITSTAPPKRPRTAYFLFMTDKRQTVQEEHPGQSVGNISKILGQMWKDLDPKEKENYQQRATLEKEKYRLDWDLYQRQQQQQKQQQSIATASEELTATAVEDSSFSSLHHDPAKNTDHVMLTLPMARIRKICRLDPQVKGISKEAVLLVTRTAELFTYKLGQETFRMAEIQKRKKLLTQDVVDVTQLKETFYFLKDDLLDLFKEQQQQQQQQQQKQQQKQQQDNATTHSAPDPKRPMSTKAAMAIANTKPLTSFFHKK